MFSLCLSLGVDDNTDFAYITACTWWKELWPHVIIEGFKDVTLLPRANLVSPVSQPEIYLTAAYVALADLASDVNKEKLYDDLLQFIIDSPEMDDDWSSYARTMRELLKVYNMYKPVPVAPFQPEADNGLLITWDELTSGKNPDELLEEKLFEFANKYGSSMN